jgi:hypothetical protein
MRIRAFVAKNLREGDTFTAADFNPPELAGKTVWDLEVLGRNVYLTMTDRTCASVDHRAVVEIAR